MNDEKAKAKQLEKDVDVQRELEQTTGTAPPTAPKIEPKKQFWLVPYILILLGLTAIYYVSRLGYFALAGAYLPAIERALVGAMAVAFVLMVLRAVRIYLIRPLTNHAARYNLNRVIKLVAGLAVCFIILSVLFANWYTAVVSLGLISLILGFALQTPITSFIGWIYILVKMPYKVGDRIKIGEAAGDVIGVGYLDTTLWEFHGEYLSTDHPSGRIIKFPNSSVLNAAVYNYSWPLFPYIWNEIKLNIGYESDLQFVATTMQRIAEEELGEAMMERVEQYRRLLARTPVDELEVREHPRVVFRVSENTWLEAIVRYLVAPREAGPVKTRLIKKLLPALNAAPDKVLFPKGPNR